MRIIQDMKWMAASFVLLATVIHHARSCSSVAGPGTDWLDAMVQAVLIEQTKDGAETVASRPMSRNWRWYAPTCSTARVRRYTGR
jgi:hypothetical protein